MQYQKLGKSGLSVSRLSFGSWLTFGAQLDRQTAIRCMATAFEQGVNFFDNAETYGSGTAEEMMGAALKELAWPRLKFIVSTKFYWGLSDGPNERNTLNRKYLMQAIDGSLKRLQLDFVDLVYCHRPDPETPIEETVWAMNDMIQSGKALYWGTSEWNATAIESAFAVCDSLGLRKPIVEQPQYNLFHRERVETEYAPLFERFGLGLTTWSPLASGVLTGKYLDGIPSESRLHRPDLAWLKDQALNEARNESVKSFLRFAAQADSTPAQLALAWCLRNKRVSSVITGASRPQQVVENLGAFKILEKTSEEFWGELERAFSRKQPH